MSSIQIVATIGPASKDHDTIKRMIESGMSLARLNFSWGTHEEHTQFVETIRVAAAEVGVEVPVIQDLSGPRVQKGSDHTFNADDPVITEKDKKDLAVASTCQVEYVAMSFVRDAADINTLRGIMDEKNISSKIIAKIERQEALDNIDEIIAVADGIMIARGDLGDAIDYATLPFVKKDILRRCREVGKPVIVATEMLTSMIDDTDPNRADISDIAHAVLDGTSATMLSNETAVGSNPVETVAVMRRVVDEAQKHAVQINPARF